MKNFLVRHGEKVFLAVVGLIAAWSLWESLGKLRLPTSLARQDDEAIEKIKEALKENRPDLEKEGLVLERPLCRTLLAERLGGYGLLGVISERFKTDPISGHMIHWLPVEEGDRPPPEVRVRIDRPGGVTAEAGRGRITVGWNGVEAEGDKAYAKILRYELFRRRAGEKDYPREPLHREPAAGAKSYSYVDTAVGPQTKYTYRVQAVGKAAPPGGSKVIIDGTVREIAGELYPPVSGEASATTPSDIEFECKILNRYLGEWKAVISIRHWNRETQGWDVFTTPGRGMSVGDRIVGERPGANPTDPPEKFDSGYVLESIRPIKVRMPVEKKEYYEDPPGSGRVKTRMVIKYREKGVHRLRIRQVDGKRKVEIFYPALPEGAILPSGEAVPARKAAPEEKPGTKPKETREAKPEGPRGSLIDEMRKRAAEGRRLAAPAPGPEEAPKTAPKAPTGPVEFRSDKTSVRLTLPAGWKSVGGDIVGAFDIKGKSSVRMELSLHLVDVYAAKDPLTGVVIGDREAEEKAVEALAGKERGGVAADKFVGLVCEGLKAELLKRVPKAEARGDKRLLSTAAGMDVAAFAITVPAQIGPRVLVSYCALAPGHIYMLSFLCPESEFDSLQRSFDGIVRTWRW